MLNRPSLDFSKSSEESELESSVKKISKLYELWSQVDNISIEPLGKFLSHNESSFEDIDQSFGRVRIAL